jgi:hypothetical protein
MNSNCIIKVLKKIVSMFCHSNDTKTKGDNSPINVTKGNNSPINATTTKGDNSPIIMGDNNVYRK